MPVRGNLRDMSLPSLISVNCNEMNEGCLVLRNGEQEATVFFQGGNIVHMVLGSLEGEDVIHELLAWEDGEFELRPGVGSPRRSVVTPWSALLLKGVQHLDEAAEEGLVAQDSTEVLRGASVSELAAQLRALEGVSGVVVVAKDGIVLSSDLEGGDPDQEGAVAAYIGGAATQIGESLYMGAFERGVVDMGSGLPRMLVISQPDYYVGLFLTERTSPALVADKAGSTLR